MSDETEKKDPIPELPDTMPEEEALSAGEKDAERTRGSNDYFYRMMDRNFLEYASYVIKDRAIPDVDDGLKPVQRRILWAMHRIDRGRNNKVAYVVGEVMGKYHPHGDASIGEALVVLANKEYFIEKQGNFGNILTGDSAAAARYIECGLTPLAREVLFNDDLTELVDTYDGRNQEPVVLPVKIPALLMLGSDGIAVGMATKILPHNFNELLRAQIAVLRHEPFELYPDFPQGGLMDVREYADGNGKITIRAKIDIVDRKLVIREIPYTKTTENIIASIEKAAEKNKIKIASVRDYTTDKVEIEVIPTRGYDVEKALQALYTYTDCSVSISPNLTVIKDFRPTVMSVTEVLHRNTEKLLHYLKTELENDLRRQNELFHAKTLAQIFFENRIYKRIEECKDEEAEYAEVAAGLAPFRDQLRRDVTREDIDKLLALPVRRISRFDIEKNQKELREILAAIAEINKKLRRLTDYAIQYLEELLAKYGAAFPRRTEIEHLDKIDRQAAALNNIKIGWDRRNGYIGTAIKSDDTITCNEFDKLLCIEKSGTYKVIPLPSAGKLFVDRLYDCRKYDPTQEFGIIYREIKSGKYYGKRSCISKFILEKEYNLCPPGCKLELLTPRADAIYTLTSGNRRNTGKTQELNLMTLPLRSPKARGIIVSSRELARITHLRYLEAEELEALRQTVPPEETDEEELSTENQASENTVAAEAAAVAEPAIEPTAAVPEAGTAPEPAAAALSPAKPAKPDGSAEPPVVSPVEAEKTPEVPKEKAPTRKPRRGSSAATPVGTEIPESPEPAAGKAENITEPEIPPPAPATDLEALVSALPVEKKSKPKCKRAVPAAPPEKAANDGEDDEIVQSEFLF